MIVDLHSHTYFSFCGHDEPETLVLKMIDSGVNVLGINDHNYGIDGREGEYISTIRGLAEKYKDKINILCGIEISTFPDNCPKQTRSFAEYDYCLVEHLDCEWSVMNGDIVYYTKGYSCPVGIAHTDLPAFAKLKGVAVEDYFKHLADNGIFWEMNVNYDSIHGYREHAFVKEFVKSRSLQQAAISTGLRISVGFDGHYMADYNVSRVRDMCDFLNSIGITPFVPGRERK